MKVIVAGGTGFIGKAVCRRLEERGHQVTVLSRRPPDNGKRNLVLWDGVNVGSWAGALSGAGAVVNLCGESVAEGRWTVARKKRLVDSRLAPTRALVAAIRGVPHPPPVLVSASAVGFYGNSRDQSCAEQHGPGAGFLADLCRRWEDSALAAAPGARVALLRFGVVLHPEGGALAKMLPAFRWFLGGPLGGGRQWMSWISLDDAAGLVLHAIENELSGPVNATAPIPVTNAEFSKALCAALERPCWARVPGFALRLLLGEMAGMLLEGQKAPPDVALKSQYSFAHAEIKDALRAYLK